MEKLVVVSVDAMIYEDLAYMRGLPTMSAVLKNCAMVKRVRSIYPTLTYPCHATMRSGCYPERHGIVHNCKVIPGDTDTPWLWFHEAMRCEDLFDVCKLHGLTTSAVGWPTTGNHPNIDYLVDEVAGLKLKTREAFRGYYTSTGTSDLLYQEIVEPILHYRCGEIDDVRTFNAEAACAIIRSKRPDLMMVHLGEPDSSRHKYGVFSPEVYSALDFVDSLLGRILEAVKDTGAETNVVITADHGQLDTIRYVFPNVLLLENDLIRVDDQGELIDWDAWCMDSGMSAMVYLKDPHDEQLKEKVFKIFSDQMQKGNSGIGYVFNESEASKFHLSGEFSFVLETDGHSAFSQEFQGPYERPHMNRRLKGSHGFHPDFGPRHPFIGVGPAFRSGAVLEHADLVDGAPTYAKLLGVSLPQAQGQVLTELMK